MLKLHPLLRETLTSYLWVAVSLLTLTLSNTPTVIPNIIAYPPQTLVLLFLALQALIWEAIPLSLGCTMNPALELATTLTSPHPQPFLPAALAQTFGHILAIYTARRLAPPSAAALFDLPRPLASTYTFPAAVSIELSLTLLLVLTVLSSSRLGAALGPAAPSAAVSAVVVAIASAGRGSTGGLVNPSMGIALALFDDKVGAWDVAVYLVGPVAGAALGAALFRGLVPDEKRKAKWVDRLRKKQERQGDGKDGQAGRMMRAGRVRESVGKDVKVD